jgi:hypothetical protein
MGLRRRWSVPVLVLAAAVTIAAAAPAHACRGLRYETSTVLATLPTAAYQENIVAKVEIVELLGWRPGWSGASVVKTRVVDGLKGIETGQALIVLSRGSTCDQIFSLHDIGAQGYVAGNTEKSQDGETVFIGAWQGWPGEPRRVR